jgi:hypothetical protein
MTDWRDERGCTAVGLRNPPGPHQCIGTGALCKRKTRLSPMAGPPEFSMSAPCIQITSLTSPRAHAGHSTLQFEDARLYWRCTLGLAADSRNSASLMDGLSIRLACLAYLSMSDSGSLNFSGEKSCTFLAGTTVTLILALPDFSTTHSRGGEYRTVRDGLCGAVSSGIVDSSLRRRVSRILVGSKFRLRLLVDNPFFPSQISLSLTLHPIHAFIHTLLTRDT